MSTEGKAIGLHSNENNSQPSNDWVIVAERKQNQKKMRKVHVCGEDVAEGIDVVVSNKWFHVSKFEPSTSELSLSTYVAKKFDVDVSSVKCFKLVKKDATNLKYINFKVGIPTNYHKLALIGSNWPKNTIVREFVPRDNTKNEEVVKVPQAREINQGQEVNILM